MLVRCPYPVEAQPPGWWRWSVCPLAVCVTLLASGLTLGGAEPIDAAGPDLPDATDGASADGPPDADAAEVLADAGYLARKPALDALREGLAVTVDPEAVRGVEVAPGDSERALAELREAGATIGG